MGRSVVRDDFEWDEEKGAANLEKHGVPFDDAIAALEDPNGLDFPDARHDGRVITLGLSCEGRVLCVVSLPRAERTRIISARKAERHEERRYYEA
ncbi:MAG TPA: BrnT family toxin [Polyangiaceae bacterium]